MPSSQDGPSYRDPEPYSAGSYNDDHAGRDRAASASSPRHARRQSFEDDPYAPKARSSLRPPVEAEEDTAAQAAADAEAAAAERKRKKKEKKRREEAEAAAAAAAASGAAAFDEPEGDDPFSSSVIPTTVSAFDSSPAPAAAVGGEEKKKKKKKDKTASMSAAPSAAAQYAAVAAQPAASTEVDLTAFADTGNGNGAHAGGDFDFLSGSGNGGGRDLNSMFQSSTISESQPTLWDQVAQPTAQQDDFGFGAASSSPAAPQQGKGASSNGHGDLWGASGLLNLDRLDQAPAAPKRSSVVEGGVSMSMMKGMNPNAAPTPKRVQGNGGGSFGGAAAMPPAAGPFAAASPFAATGGFAAPGGYGQGKEEGGERRSATTGGSQRVACAWLDQPTDRCARLSFLFLFLFSSARSGPADGLRIPASGRLWCAVRCPIRCAAAGVRPPADADGLRCAAAGRVWPAAGCLWSAGRIRRHAILGPAGTAAARARRRHD